FVPSGADLAAGRPRLDQSLSLKMRVKAALCHQVEQHRGDRLRLQHRPGIAVAHRKALERQFGGLTFLELLAKSPALEGKQPEIDCVAKKEAIDRSCEKRGDTQVAQ